MPRKSKTGTEPVRGLVLFAIFMIPFIVGLVAALVGRPFPAPWDVLPTVSVFAAMILILCLNRPMLCVWLGHMVFAILCIASAVILYFRSQDPSAAFAVIMAVMSLLTLAMMTVLVYREAGWGWQIFKSGKACRFGKLFLGYILLFLGLGIGVDIIPGMASLVESIRRTLMSMFAITYPLALWTEFLSVEAGTRSTSEETRKSCEETGRG